MKPDDQYERALRPASTAVGVALSLIGVLLAVGFAAVGIGNGTILTWGGAEACVDLQSRYPIWSVSGNELPLGPDATAFPSRGVTACAEHASFWQHLLASVGGGTLAMVYLVALIMLALLLRTAARCGPFDPSTSRALGRLGLWLLLAAPVAVVLQAMANTAMFATVSTQPVRLMDWVSEVHPPFAALITGAAVLSVARLWRIGTGMRAEIEATV